MYRNASPAFTQILERGRGLTVHGHFIDLCTIILLDVSKDAYIIVLDKVDGNSPPTVPP